MVSESKRPSLAAMVLALFNLGFWVAFGRLEHAVLTIASSGTLELLAVPLVGLAPLVFGLWWVLRRRGLEPAIVIKFGLGFVMLALSCFFLAMGVEWSFVAGTVELWAVVACTSSLALAALCLGPAGLAAARELGGRDNKGVWVGGWLVCVLLGRAAGVWTSPSALALDQVFLSCMSMGLSGVLAGVLLGMSWRPLAQLSVAENRGRGRVSIARTSSATSLSLAATLLVGCSDDTISADDRGSTTDPGGSTTDPDTSTDTSTSEGTSSDTGDTTDTSGGECGDAVVDPGEDCDDGNDDDNDGCTSSCEIGPCGFEWIRREPMVVPDGIIDMQIEGASMITVTQPPELDTWPTVLSHASLVDGALESTLEFGLQPANEQTTAFALEAGGDRFLASFGDADPDTPLHVHRVTSEGALVWQHDRVEDDPTWAMAAATEVEGGPLVFMTTTSLSAMDTDAKVVALDSSDGSERWTQSYTGVTAANGYSLDWGAAAAVDAQGRVYAGMTEYVDWDTTAAVVVAYGPDGGDPLWVTELIHVPGRYAQPQSLSFGAPGMLLATVQEWEGFFESWIVAVDAQTGDVLWVFNYDDLPVERSWTAALGVAGDDQRVLAGGYWSYFDEQNGGFQVVQAYAVGLNLDGSLACFGTYDEYDPKQLDDLHSWAPFAIDRSADGSFYMAGSVLAWYGDPPPANELLLARIR